MKIGIKNIVLFLSFLFFTDSIAAKVDSTTLTVTVVKECTDITIDSALVSIFKNDSVLVTSTYTNSHGVASLSVKRNQEYQIRVSKDTRCNWFYFSNKEIINPISEYLNLEYSLLQYDMSITYSPIEFYFEIGSKELHITSEDDLYKYLEFIKNTCPFDNSQYEIPVNSDCSLGEKKAYKLCNKRIKTLKKIIYKELSFDKEQIVFINLGASRPKNYCDCNTIGTEYCDEKQLFDNNKFIFFSKTF